MRFLTFVFLAIATTSESSVVVTSTDYQCPKKPRTPTVIGNGPFNVGNAVEALRQATEPSTINEREIIEVFIKRSNDERQEILDAFVKSTAELLDNRFTALSGDFWDLMIGLSTSPAAFLAEDLLIAVHDDDYNTIIEILAPLSNKDIKEVYSVNSEITYDVKKKFSGHYQTLVLSLLNATREETCDTTEASLSANVGSLSGSDMDFTKAVITLFTTKSYPVLLETYKKYEEIHNKNLWHVIEERITDKPLRDAILQIVLFIVDSDEYFARRLFEAMDGLGTTESILNRIIIVRSDIDLGRIKIAYQRMYGNSLADDIKGDTSGNYEDALLALIGE